MNQRWMLWCWEVRSNLERCVWRKESYVRHKRWSFVENQSDRDDYYYIKCFRMLVLELQWRWNEKQKLWYVYRRLYQAWDVRDFELINWQTTYMFVRESSIMNHFFKKRKSIIYRLKRMFFANTSNERVIFVVSMYVFLTLMLCFYWWCNRLIQFVNLSDIDSFQNEALKHNNFVDLALWECRKIWIFFTTSDIVLSLEIDTKDELRLSTTSHFRHVFNDDFISRLCRSFMFSLNDERVWRELINRLDENARIDYFRLNISLQESKSRLNDIDQMYDLKRFVQL